MEGMSYSSCQSTSLSIIVKKQKYVSNLAVFCFHNISLEFIVLLYVRNNFLLFFYYQGCNGKKYKTLLYSKCTICILSEILLFYFLDVEKIKNVAKEYKTLKLILEHCNMIDERLTAQKLIDLWVGKGNPKCRPPGYQATSLSRETCERIVALLLIDTYLIEEFHFTPYSTISYINTGKLFKFILVMYKYFFK